MTFDCASAPMPDIVERLKEHAEWAEAKIDAVPVVRCKDCKYARKLKDNFYGWDFSCKHFNTHAVRSNDFCSYGERKDVSE